MKKQKGNLDFLPNIQNKYSIRRFTVGTASILLGSFIFLGVNDANSAYAEEENSQGHQLEGNEKNNSDRTIDNIGEINVSADTAESESSQVSEADTAESES
ncbi:YSIRK-type signal peptide-containing protein, partial [Staphylococcus equorum]